MSTETPDSCAVCTSPTVVPTALGGPDRLLGTPGTFHVVRCLACGAGRTLPSVTEAELAGFYPSQYHAHTEGEGTAYGAAWRLGQALRWRAVFRRWPLRDLLEPGGTLIVEVPNFDAWQRRRMGSRWFHLDLPRHRTHFTAEALRRAAEASGFELVEVRDSSDPGALIGTLQYRFFGHVVLGSGWGGAAWAASSLVLSPVMRLLDRVAGGRDFLHLVARKPRAAG